MSKREAQSSSFLPEHLSHALRTPLGTCLGVLEDLLAGYELTPEEIRDGRDAARKIQSTLDALRDTRSEKVAVQIMPEEAAAALREALRENGGALDVELSTSVDGAGFELRGLRRGY